MPLSRERIPVAAPIEGRGSSWLTQYEEMKGAVRMRNYSDKTLEAYRYWIVKFQAFVWSKPPDHLNTEDAKGFLTDLAVRQNVAGATQNQAFNALLFFLPACFAPRVWEDRWGCAGQEAPIRAGGAFARGG